MITIRKTNLVLLGLLLAGSAFARDEYSRAVDKTLPLRNGQRIFLENRFGDVMIRTHRQSEVSIHADIRVSASSEEQAKTYADKVEIRIEPASDLSIRTLYPYAGRSFGGLRWSNVSYSVRYELTVPEGSPLAVRNAFGGVSVTGIRANCEITTSHGELLFRDGRGVQRIENSFGRIAIGHNVGNVSVANSNGAVEIADVEGGATIRDRFASLTVARVSNGVSLTNTNGAVEVQDSGGAGDIRNAFGSVTVQNFRGDLSVTNANGKIEVGNVSGSANLRTTFAAINVAGVKGQLSIRGNNARISGSRVGGPLSIVNSFGAVEATNVERDVTIESGNGAVTLTNIGGAAHVKTSFGAVQASHVGGKFVVQNANGAVRASQVQGAEVRTSFGSVSLDDVAGPILVENQNGAVEVSSTLRGSCEPIAIHTSFSALRVHLQPDASYRVSARTSFGRIRSDFPMTVAGSVSNDSVSGVLGGGRCEMRLTDNNGSIEILKYGQ